MGSGQGAAALAARHTADGYHSHDDDEIKASEPFVHPPLPDNMLGGPAEEEIDAKLLFLLNTDTPLVFQTSSSARLAFLAYMRDENKACLNYVLGYVFFRSQPDSRLAGLAGDWERGISRYLFGKQLLGFLDSPQYSMWCMQEFACKITSFQIIQLAAAVLRPEAGYAVDISEVTACMRQLPALKALASHQWISFLVPVLELLSLGVVLSAPDHAAGFPILFANREAAALLGVHRLTLLGVRSTLVLSEELYSSYAIPRRAQIEVLVDGLPTQLAALSKPVYDGSEMALVMTVLSTNLGEATRKRMVALLLDLPHYFCHGGNGCTASVLLRAVDDQA